DEPLGRVDGIRRVGDGLTLRRLAYQALAAGREADDRRRGSRALGVGDDAHVDLARGAGLDDGDAGVGGSEVDPDDFGHSVRPSIRRRARSRRSRWTEAWRPRPWPRE